MQYDPLILGFLVIFCLPLLLVNIWATRRVLASDEFEHRKLILIITVWIVPFLGAFMIKDHIRDNLPREKLSAYETRELSGIIDSEAPEKIEIEGIPAFDILANAGLVNNFPFFDWAAISAWISSIEDEGRRREAHAKAQLAWLLHMRDALGPHFRLHEAGNAYLLSSYVESQVIVATTDYINLTRTRIQRVLEEIAAFPENGKSILLVMDDDDSYYNYVSSYYPDEGEFAYSSGMFIGPDCPHFVAKRDSLDVVEPVIAHEMTHSAVSRLNLPKWLDEGLAVNTEQRLKGIPRLIYTPHELHQMHLSFWDEAKIQEFWSGKSFHRTDQGNLLSYELARILVEQMARNWSSLKNFVLHAQQEDAGANAASEFLPISLASYVCPLFEEDYSELWEPDPSKWGQVGEILPAQADQVSSGWCHFEAQQLKMDSACEQ